MAIISPSEPITTENLLTLPQDGMDRWLIRGELREKPMTVRNRLHSEVLAALASCLKVWRDAQPEPRGKVLAGEAGVRLTRNPDTTVGIDVVFVSAETMARQTDKTTLIEGVPLLAAEILSPSDTNEEINEKIDVYLSSGVRLIWIIDPYRRTVTIFGPQLPAKIVAEGQELIGDDVLPGFRVAVASLFQ